MPGITIASVDPANAQVGIYRNRPATVRIQNADSTDYTKKETTDADFSVGTLTDVVGTVDSLVLAGTTFDDFETDTVGQPPAGWTVYQGGARWTVESKDSQKALRNNYGSDERDLILWTAEGAAADREIQVDVQITANPTYLMIVARAEIVSPFRYYCVYFQPGGNLTLYRRDSEAGYVQLGTPYALNPTAGSWYTIRFGVSGTTIHARAWLRSGSDPGTWQTTATDSTYTTGYAGVAKYTLGTIWVDNFALVGVPDYVSSGNRVSPAYPLSSVGKFGAALIEWDATLPALTSLVMKVSKNGSDWTTVANGDHLALWNEGDDLTSENLYLKQELATTDVSVTPHLTEVRVIFRPVDPSLVELVVNGVSCTVANGGLTYWNTAIYSGGVIVDYHEDVWFATLLPWWDYGLESVNLVVNVADVERSATTFTTEEFESFWANGYSKWMANALGGAYDGPMAGFGHYFVSTIEPWLIRGEFHYNVQGAPLGAFDAYYYVAHVFAMDTPASGIVGQPCPSDTPASGIVEGWTPSDTPASGIVQGWMRRDYPASGIAGVRVLRDEPASGIVGKRTQSDTPGSGVVYQVNLNNTIELRVLSVEEAAALAELGISFE